MKKPTQISPTIEELDKQLKELDRLVTPVNILGTMFYKNVTVKDLFYDEQQELSEIEKEQERDPYQEEIEKDSIDFGEKDKFL